MLIKKLGQNKFLTTF